MRTKRRVRVRVESESVLIVRGRQGLIRAHCGNCDRGANFITLGEVCNASRRDAESLRRMADDGVIHTIEMTEGPTLICLPSALKLLGDAAGGRGGGSGTL